MQRTALTLLTSSSVENHHQTNASISPESSTASEDLCCVPHFDVASSSASAYEVAPPVVHDTKEDIPLVATDALLPNVPNVLPRKELARRYRCTYCPEAFTSFKSKRVHILEKHQISIAVSATRTHHRKSVPKLGPQPKTKRRMTRKMRRAGAAGAAAGNATMELSTAVQPLGTKSTSLPGHTTTAFAAAIALKTETDAVASKDRTIKSEPLSIGSTSEPQSATVVKVENPNAKIYTLKQQAGYGPTHLHQMTRYLLNHNWNAFQRRLAAQQQLDADVKDAPTFLQRMAAISAGRTNATAAVSSTFIKGEPVEALELLHLRSNSFDEADVEVDAVAAGTVAHEPDEDPRCPLWCAVCYQTFVTIKQYDSHLAIHPAECFTCSRTFQHWVNLSVHLKRHLNIRDYACTICPKRFVRRQALVEHLNVHTGNAPLKCKLCPRTFRRYSNLIHHRKRTHLNIRPQKDFICACGEVFHSEAKMAWHRETHDTKPKCCPFCRERFVHRTSLSRHIRLSHKERFAPAEILTAAAALAAQAAAAAALSSTDATCGAPTSGTSFLDSTDRTAPDAFSSGDAETVSRTAPPTGNAAVAAAIALIVHRNGRKVAEFIDCAACGGCFRKASMKAHLKKHALADAAALSTNTGAAAQNEVAQAAVADPNATNQAAVAVPATVPPLSVEEFSCAICNKMFTTKWNLKQHKWIHASGTTKPFRCSMCPKSFVRENDFVSHQNAHRAIKPYTCDHCGSQFGNKYNWLRHTKEHEKAKGFKCDECGKEFHRSYYLTEHKRSHTGERPFECVICGKTSTTKTNHNKHVKIHHARDPLAAEV